jgi:hypothetical protein
MTELPNYPGPLYDHGIGNGNLWGFGSGSEIICGYGDGVDHSSNCDGQGEGDGTPKGYDVGSGPDFEYPSGGYSFDLLIRL